MADNEVNEDDFDQNDVNDVLFDGPDLRVHQLTRQQLIHLHELTCDDLSSLVDRMASVSGVLLGLAEGYDRLCRHASFGRIGRARKIDFLIQDVVVQTDSPDGASSAELNVQWKGLLGSQMDHYRRRGTLASRVLTRRRDRLHDLPLKMIQLEITRLQDLIAVYQKRIAVDQVRIHQMALSWANSCRIWGTFRYLFVENILRDAIVDYCIQ